MSFPLSVFLIPYFIFLIIWALMMMVALYHILRFGFKNFTTILTTLVFIVVTILILMISYNYLSQIDWAREVTVFGNLVNPSQLFR